MEPGQTEVPISIESGNKNALRQIEQALKKAAKTSEEKLFAKQGTEALKKFRDGWKLRLEQEKILAKREGKAVSVEDVVRQSAQLMLVDTRMAGSGQGVEYRPSVRILSHLETVVGGVRKTTEPSTEFTIRVLQNMGVLKPHETLDYLRSLPPVKERRPGDPPEPKGSRYKVIEPGSITPGGPVYMDPTPELYGGYADHVPSNIAGIDVGVFLSRPQRVWVSMDLPTLQKVVGFS